MPANDNLEAAGGAGAGEPVAADPVLGTPPVAGEEILVVLPLPSGLLSPNKPPGSYGGRMAKAGVAKKYRRVAKEAVEAQEIGETWGSATVRVEFFHKQVRRRDDVNYLAMLKPAYDGFVDAGLLEDDDADHLTTLGATFEIDKKHPRVELLIQRTS